MKSLYSCGPLLVGFLALGCLQLRADEYDVLLSVGGGQSSYQETIRFGRLPATKSDWDAPFGSIAGEWLARWDNRLAMHVSGDYWASGTDSETWKNGGLVVQRNDMQLDGFDLLWELGVTAMDDKRTQVIPFAGVGYSFQQFERSKFDVLAADPEEDVGRVDEDFSLGYGTGGVLVTTTLSEGLEARLLGRYGHVFFYEAENSIEELGRIEGDGGYLVDFSLGLFWSYSEKQALGVHVEYGLQNLDGATEPRIFETDAGPVDGLVQLPDNELERVTVQVAWKTDI